MQRTLRPMRPEELARVQASLHVRPYWAYAVFVALATDDENDDADGDGDSDSTPRFPNRELLITRLPNAGDILDLQRLGDHFPPSATLPAFTREHYEQNRVPEDGQILPGPLSLYAPR